MKIEFPVLESEPLIYFLLHSGVFVLILACVFFFLGIWMGAAIWGRYKKQLNDARQEIAGQFQEIAVLKRKLAEQSMRPSSGPLNPPPALLTEVLPAVGDVFPERKAEIRPPTFSSKVASVAATATSPVTAPAPAVTPASDPTPFVTPALAEMPKIEPEPAPVVAPAPAAPLFAPAPVAAPIISLTPTPAPLVPVADAEAHADPALPASESAPAAKRKPAAIRRPTMRVKVRKETKEAGAAVAPLAESAAPEKPEIAEAPAAADSSEDVEPLLLSEVPALASPLPALVEDSTPPEEAAEDDEFMPFGFLLGDSPEPATPSMSTLADILKNAAEEVKSISQPASFITPPVSAPPPPVSELPSVLPEIDPSLGLIYKIAPTETDDLTRIKGIASVLEKRLHELGIYTWRQIASWDDGNIREFSSRLSFKDRIVREKWVEQARSLNEARHIA